MMSQIRMSTSMMLDPDISSTFDFCPFLGGDSIVVIDLGFVATMVCCYIQCYHIQCGQIPCD